MHIENTILKRWDRGQTSIKIGNDLNIRPAYVRVLVQRARKNGDLRAHKRGKGRLHGLPILLSPDVLVMLGDEAERRDTTERELATQILTMALRHNLVAAVVDDEDGE